MKALDRFLQLLNVKPRGVNLPIPPQLLLGADSRPGLSADRISRKVFEREKEIYSAEQPHREMYRIIIEEVIRDIQENCVVEVAIPQGTQVVNAQGGNVGGPITVVGTILTTQSGKGIVK